MARSTMSAIREVMSTVLVTVEPTATLAEAATVMGQHHVGSALVMEDGAFAGIFTERDLLRALGSDFDAAHHSVSQWMTRNPSGVHPDADTAEALEMMLTHGFRHLPVLDGGEVVGVVSIRDLSRTLG